jgi:hypothetical protein
MTALTACGECATRAYLAGLRNDMQCAMPIADGEDKDLVVGLAPLHGINHGADHRAQLLRLLNDLPAASR